MRDTSFVSSSSVCMFWEPNRICRLAVSCERTRSPSRLDGGKMSGEKPWGFQGVAMGCWSAGNWSHQWFLGSLMILMWKRMVFCWIWMVPSRLICWSWTSLVSDQQKHFLIICGHQSLPCRMYKSQFLQSQVQTEIMMMLALNEENKDWHVSQPFHIDSNVG